MTEKEYFKKLKEIRNHISAGRLEYADELLTNLYHYKPVRLLWFVAKAEYVLAKDGDPVTALKVLEGERYLIRKYFLGEDYPGLKDCIKFRAAAFRKMGRERDAVREEYCYERVCGTQGGQLEEALAEAVEAFAEDSENTKALEDLGDAFYRTADMVSYFIIRMVMLRQGLLREDDRSEWFYQIPNFGYLEERICSEEPDTFVLIMDEHLGRELEVLGHLLHGMGHKVYLLTPPLAFETEEQLELGDTLAVSLDNAEQYPDMCVIPPVVLTKDGEPYGDNRDHIIDHICRNESGNDHALLLCSGELLDGFYRDGPLRGRLGRLSSYETDCQEKKVQFGWVGSYLSYISNIYGYDVRPDIETEPTVDFSIVVPARNSAKTLRYTLQTCLNQRYMGSYEVLVSDNSVEGSTEVYDLCRELNNPKIRYVKTPGSLTLTKSFEFAYLQTRGEFVLSIGSDDGVLPWALDVLKQAMDQFPQEEIIQWERGFYAWPGFNGGQENMFTIPRAYNKEQISFYSEKTSNIFDWIKQDQQAIYVMPNLYINSGFRRQYLKTLLQKTGKLLDGISQDIQTGIVNCCIQKQILKIVYSLTVAGMSPSSIGYVGNAVEDEETRKQNQKIRQNVSRSANKGVWVSGQRSRHVPPIAADSCLIYTILAEAGQEGLMSEAQAEQIQDWKTTVLHTYQTYPNTREDYDLSVQILRFAARKLGEQKWFEGTILRNALTPRYVDEQKLKRQIETKSYQEGPTPAGGETLDASRFGVQNISDAVDLFVRRVEGK